MSRSITTWRRTLALSYNRITITSELDLQHGNETAYLDASCYELINVCKIKCIIDHVTI